MLGYINAGQLSSQLSSAQLCSTRSMSVTRLQGPARTTLHTARCMHASGPRDQRDVSPGKDQKGRAKKKPCFQLTRTPGPIVWFRRHSAAKGARGPRDLKNVFVPDHTNKNDSEGSRHIVPSRLVAVTLLSRFHDCLPVCQTQKKVIAHHTAFPVPLARNRVTHREKLLISYTGPRQSGVAPTRRSRSERVLADLYEKVPNRPQATSPPSSVGPRPPSTLLPSCPSLLSEAGHLSVREGRSVAAGFISRPLPPPREPESTSLEHGCRIDRSTRSAVSRDDTRNKRIPSQTLPDQLRGKSACVSTRKSLARGR